MYSSGQLPPGPFLLQDRPDLRIEEAVRQRNYESLLVQEKIRLVSSHGRHNE